MIILGITVLLFVFSIPHLFAREAHAISRRKYPDLEIFFDVYAINKIE